MDEKNKGLERYAQAVSCLPPRLMHLALGLPDAARQAAEEVRLRAGGALPDCVPRTAAARLRRTSPADMTDRLAGCLYGIRVLVVQPMTRDIKKGILFRRKLEKPFIEKYFKQGGKLL